MTERKKTTYESNSISIDYETVEEGLRLIRDKIGEAERKGVTNIKFNLDVPYSDASPRLTLVGDIDETDDQMAFRLANEARQEQWDRQQLARLKAKYGE